MAGLPYQVFVRRKETSEPWRAPIWRSFGKREQAEREMRAFLENRSEANPAVFADVTGPDGTRRFTWEDGAVREVSVHE